MLAVGDDLGGEVVEVEGGFEDAAAHGIGLELAQPAVIGMGAEEVVEVAHAPADGVGHLPEGGERMAGGADDAPAPAGADKRLGAGQLRRDRGRGNAVGELEILLVLARIGGPETRCRMRPPGGRGEVRPIEMGPEDAGAAGALPSQLLTELQEAHVLFMGRHRGGRADAGGAVAGVSLTNDAEALFVAVHEVMPAAAVGVQFDKAGAEIAALQVDAVAGRRRAVRRSHGLNEIVTDLDATIFDELVCENDRAPVKGEGHLFVAPTCACVRSAGRTYSTWQAPHDTVRGPYVRRDVLKSAVNRTETPAWPRGVFFLDGAGRAGPGASAATLRV